MKTSNNGQMIIYGFDYSDWTPFSIRMNSENYMSSDGKYVLKLLSASVMHSFDDILDEVYRLKLVQKMGLPTPKVFDVVVTNDGKIGYISEYIKYKKSVSRAIHDEPYRIDEFCSRFATLAKKLHSTQCLTEYFLDVKEESRKAVLKLDSLSNSEKNVLLAALDRLPSRVTCIHGDFNFSNFIVSDMGDFLIDLSYMGYGDPMFDWGLLYFFATNMTDIALDKVFHMDSATAVKAVKYAYMKYSGINDIEKAEEYLEKALPYGMCMAAYHSQFLTVSHLEIWIKNSMSRIIK